MISSNPTRLSFSAMLNEPDPRYDSSWLRVAGYWPKALTEERASVLLVTGYWLLAEGTDRGTSVSVAGLNPWSVSKAGK